jgi:hypothetical protein
VPAADHYVPAVDKTIHVRTLDLQGTPPTFSNECKRSRTRYIRWRRLRHPVLRGDSPTLPGEPLVLMSQDTTTPFASRGVRSGAGRGCVPT